MLDGFFDQVFMRLKKVPEYVIDPREVQSKIEEDWGWQQYYKSLRVDFFENCVQFRAQQTADVIYNVFGPLTLDYSAMDQNQIDQWNQTILDFCDQRDGQWHDLLRWMHFRAASQ